MSKPLHSGVVFNALQAHPELEIIGNELITRINKIIDNPQVEFSTSNGVNRLRFFGIIELSQDASQCGYISYTNQMQIENFRDGIRPTKLKSWSGCYIDSSTPSSIKLPLESFNLFTLPISILYAQKYGDHFLVKNYLVNAVLFQLVQEKPELFCAPLRSLYWVSSYIHYIEQIFKLENTSIDSLPFEPFETSKLDDLCNITVQAYIHHFLDPKLVELFCFHNFDSNKQGDIHQQYVRFVNTFGFSANELYEQFKKDPLIYALSVLYSDRNRFVDGTSFLHFNPIQIVSHALLTQCAQQHVSIKRLLIRNLSTLLDNGKLNIRQKVVHDLYLHTVNRNPCIALSDAQLNLHYDFLSKAQSLDLLTLEQFEYVLLGIDALNQVGNPSQVITYILDAVELIKALTMDKNKAHEQTASNADLNLMAHVKAQIDFKEVVDTRMEFISLINRYREIQHNFDSKLSNTEAQHNFIEEFNFQNENLTLNLITKIDEIKHTLCQIDADASFQNEVLENNRNLIRVNYAGDEYILIVDPRMNGFKFLYENLISLNKTQPSNCTYNAVNIALQKINFG